jgi:hypothetical protein
MTPVQVSYFTPAMMESGNKRKIRGTLPSHAPPFTTLSDRPVGASDVFRMVGKILNTEIK